MPQPTESTIDIDAPPAPFGSVFGPTMAVARFDGASWSPPQVVATDALHAAPRHARPALRQLVLRGAEGAPPAGRRRRARSAPTCTSPGCARAPARLRLPVPPAALVDELIARTVAANEEIAPSPPGSLYLRPTMLGTDVTIGAAATPSATAMLYVARLPRRRLPAAAAADDRRRDGDAADDTAVRRRQDRGQLRHGPGADHRRPASATAPIRCCSRPAGGSRRPAPRTSC